MKRLFLLFAFCVPSVLAGAQNFKKLNRQAAREYQQPIRPASEGRNPCWNEFARKFTYAPTFDFPTRDGAAQYRFTLTQDTTWAYRYNQPRNPLPDFGESRAADLLTWTFTASEPTASLAPIWEKLPVGYTRLRVDAVDAGGRVLATVGNRLFLRDYPFSGPYPSAARSYKDAAARALHYIHNLKAIQNWLENDEPDMGYQLNTYACKIVGATVSLESRYAMLVPAEREAALKIARNAADFLIRVSQPADAPLAHFPPTYYKGLVASAFGENQGATMSMEALSVAGAFLDLYDASGEKRYFDQALRIADTYQRIQRADGSIPVKLYIATGEPTSPAGAMLHPLLCLLHRLETQYGVTAYREMQQKGERWMAEVAIEKFDMTGQFEDVSVQNLKPYENLTNCTAAPYASYLLSRRKPTKEEIKDAIDLIRLSEDQFVHWNVLPDASDFRRVHTPCVYEQYRYRMPVDNSACNMANAWLDLHRATGDRLALEKALSMANSIVNIQSAVSGAILTLWDHTSTTNHTWINCTLTCVETLTRFSEFAEEE